MQFIEEAIKALYVDGEPDLRIGKDGKLYYHDKNSNALTEITANQLVNKSNNNIDNIIVDYKLPPEEADKLLKKNDVKPTVEQVVEDDSDDEIAGMSKVEFAFMIIGIVIGFIILLIAIYYIVEYFSKSDKNTAVNNLNNLNNNNRNNNNNNNRNNNNNNNRNNGNNLNRNNGNNNNRNNANNNNRNNANNNNRNNANNNNRNNGNNLNRNLNNNLLKNNVKN